MLQCQHHALVPHFFPLSQHRHHCRRPQPPHNSFKPTTHFSLSALPRLRPHTWLADLPEPLTTTPIVPAEEGGGGGGGPIELPPSSSIFATSDDPTPLQIATSVLLTGAIAVFLFRSVRRRARRAKELRFRSSGVKKTLKEEAIDSLKGITSDPIDVNKPPTPVQALLGGISAGVIALILYKFTTTIEAALNRQPISDNYSVRQMTITIRTIVNGLCYLATFVFGFNSIGLFLYSAQLAFNPDMEGSAGEKTESKSNEGSVSPNSTLETPRDSVELSSPEDQSPGERQ